MKDQSSVLVSPVSITDTLSHWHHPQCLPIEEFVHTGIEYGMYYLSMIPANLFFSA